MSNMKHSVSSLTVEEKIALKQKQILEEQREYKIRVKKQARDLVPSLEDELIKIISKNRLSKNPERWIEYACDGNLKIFKMCSRVIWDSTWVNEIELAMSERNITMTIFRWGGCDWRCKVCDPTIKQSCCLIF